VAGLSTGSGRPYGFAANDTIRIAAIGTGGRCRQNAGGDGEVEKTRVVAV